jgi:hypothetical protein
VWRKEVIGCPTQESRCKVPEFCIDVNLPNYTPKKQEDKGSFIKFGIAFIWHVFDML